MNKKIIISLLFITTILISFFTILIFKNYEDPKLEIYIPTINDGIKVEIFKEDSKEGNYTDDETPKVVLSITKSGSYTINSSDYTLKISSKNSDYETRYVYISSDENYKEIDTTLNFSKDKLELMSVDEFPLAQQVILNTYPSQMNQYTIDSPKLYIDGTWYAAKLIPSKDIELYPIIRVVLKKVEGQWKIASNPPAEVLTSLQYTDIPIEILMDINNR